MAKRKQRGKKTLESAIRSTLSLKQDKPNLIPGLLGAYVNGQKTITVAGREDFVWVRLRGATSEVVHAFNDAVGLHYDLPILVYRDENNPQVWRIWGRDIRAYADWDGVSYLPPHGDSHSFSGKSASGVDPVWVNKRQYMPLMPRPNASGSMSIYLEPDFYYFDGQYHYWPGSGTTDMSGYMPTGTATARFVTVYLDSAGNPSFLGGPEYSMIPEPPDIASKIELPTAAQGVPIAAVRLYSGTSRISWGDIYDLRSPQSPIQSTGSVLGIAEDAAYLGGVGVLNFEGDLDVAVSGSYAHISHNPTGSVVVYDEGTHLGLFDEIRFIGDGVAAYNSGSYVAVEIEADQQIDVYEESVLLGGASGLNFVGGMVEAVVSGSIAHIMHTGTSTDVPTTGTIVIYDESVLLGSFKEMRFVGGSVEATDEGAYVKVTVTPGTGSTVEVYDEGNPLGVAEGFNFVGDGVQAILSGTTAHIMHTGSAGGGGHETGTMVIYDESDFLGAFEEMRFIGDGVQAYNSGSYAAVEISGGGGAFVIYNDGQFQVSGTAIDFADGLDVAVSGSRATISSAGGGGGSVDVYNSGTFLGSFSELRFLGPQIEALDSGSYTVLHDQYPHATWDYTDTDYSTINNGTPAWENNLQISIDVRKYDLVQVVLSAECRNETTDWGYQWYIERYGGAAATLLWRDRVLAYNDPNQYSTRIGEAWYQATADGTIAFRHKWASVVGGRTHMRNRKMRAINWGPIPIPQS